MSARARLHCVLAFGGLRQAARHWLACSRGIAAIEFAMVLPLMVLMYLGTTELTFAVNTDRKLTFLSRTLADLTGRTPNLSPTELSAIFNASLAVLAPYKADDVKMVVSSIVVVNTGQLSGGKPVLEGRVCWSEARGPGATALGKGTTLPVPAGFGTPNTSFVRADVELPYRAMFGAAIFKTIMRADTINMTEKTSWPVRNAPEVVYQGVAPCLT